MIFVVLVGTVCCARNRIVRTVYVVETEVSKFNQNKILVEWLCVVRRY